MKIKSQSVDFGLMILAVTIFSLVMAGSFLLVEADTDNAYFRYVGRCLLHGVPLYTGVWDCKGPILYWFSALGVWIHPQWGYNLLFTLCWCMTLLLFYRIAKRVGSCPGLCLFIFILFAFGCGGDGFLVIGRQEALGCLLVLTALSLDVGSSVRLCPFLIGVCGGLAFMVKPTFAAVGVYFLVHWLCDSQSVGRWNRFGQRISYAFVGFSLVLLLCSLAFYPDRIYELWRAIIFWNLQERAAINNTHWLFWLRRWNWFSVDGWTAVIWGASAFVASCALFRTHRWDFLFWIVIEGALIVFCPEFRGYYVIVGTIPVALFLPEMLKNRRVPLFVMMFAVTACFSFFACDKTMAKISQDAAVRKELAYIATLVDDVDSPVVVTHCRFRVLNHIGLFSEQRYPFWTIWSQQSRVNTVRDMTEDFISACSNPKCNMLFSILKLENYVSFRMGNWCHVYYAPTLDLHVYRKFNRQTEGDS